MGKICYSVAGEGRGHATRVRTIVEDLRHDHQVVLFASGFAYELLLTAYEHSPSVQVHWIPGLQFCYQQRHLNYFGSIWQNLPYLRNLPSLVDSLEEQLVIEQPDLVITDFEPALPRAARRLGLPYLSIDHQHFLTTFDLSSLPLSLWFKAKAIASTIDLFVTGQRRTIVSSFFPSYVKSSLNDVSSVGVMLRPELTNAKPSNGDHLLVYLRRFAPPRLMEVLRQCHREVFIYGLGEMARDGNLRFFPIDEIQFLDHLIHSHALISNSGNQLVGEALSLKKPVLALPEEGNFEQAVNGHFLNLTGMGVNCDLTQFTRLHLDRFLERVPDLRTQIDPRAVVGNSDALSIIRGHLPAQTVPSMTLAKVA